MCVCVCVCVRARLLVCAGASATRALALPRRYIPASLAVARPACEGWPGFVPGGGCAAAVNSTALVGPAAPLWGFGGPGGVCGGSGPLSLAASNVSATCRVYASAPRLVADASALVDNATSFLALLPTPSYVTATRALRAVVFPAGGAPPLAALRKYVWSEAFAFFPPAVTTVVRSMRLADSDMSALFGAAGAAGNATAATAWLSTLAGAAAAAQWARTLEVTSVSPAVGPASGGTLVALSGQGFGMYAPPLTVRVLIGGAPCTNVSWGGDTALACLAPPGCGLRVPIEVSVGFQKAFVAPTYGYLPATLYGVRDARGAPALSVVAGDTLVIIGSNFINVVTMQCLFGEVVVPAVVINASAVSCLAPAVPDGVVDVFVSNDGVRWSNGWQFGIAAYEPILMGHDLDRLGTGIVWPGASPRHATVPLDFDNSVMPRALALAVFVTSTGAARAGDELAVSMALRGVAATPLLLPYTTLRCAYYDASPALDAAPGAVPGILAALVGAARGALGDELVGIVGPAESPLALALATLLAAGPSPPLVQFSSRASSPALSDASQYPYFVRDVPSDALQGSALAAVIASYIPGLIEHGLMDAARRSVTLLRADDAYSAGIGASFAAAVVGTLAAVGPQVVIDLAAYNALPSAPAQHAWLVAQLQAVCAAQEHTIVGLFPGEITGAVMAAGSRACNLTSNSYMWFGADTLLETSAVAGVAAGLVVAPMASNSSLSANLTRATGSTFAPFLYDAVVSFAHATGAMARKVRSPAAASISGAPAVLMGYMRAVTTDATYASGFGGFGVGTNDPTNYQFGIYDVAGGAARAVGVYESSGAVVPNGVAVHFGRGTNYVNRRPPAVYLGLLVDVNDTAHERAVAAVVLALRAVQSSSLLRNASGVPLVALRLALLDSQGGDGAAIASALTRFAARNASLGIVGGFYSGETTVMLGTSTALALPLLATTATAVALGLPPGNAFFQRVVQPDNQQANALVDLCRRLGWRTLTPVFDAADPYGVGLFGALQQLVGDAGITLCPPAGVTTASVIAAPSSLVASVQGCHSLILVLLANQDAATATFVAAASVGLGGGGSAYEWVGVDGWIAGSLNQSIGSIGVSPGGGGSSSLVPAVMSELSHPLRAGVVDFNSSDSSVVAGINTWRTLNAHAGANVGSMGSDWGDGAAYDAVWVYAHALQQMLTDGQPLNRPHAMPYINRVSFDGVRGPIQFLIGGEGGRSVVSDGPVNGQYDISNVVQASGASALVGNVTGRGFVRFTGCAAGRSRLRDGTCAPCAADTWKADVGDIPCTPCPSLQQLTMTTNGTTGATSAAQCLCPISVYFDLSMNFKPGEWPCLPCPRGAVCPWLQITPRTMLNAVGYWRGNPNATVFDKCFLPERCSLVGPTLPAGSDGSFSTPCPQGYTGPLCAACTSGYGRDITQSCQPCSPVGVTAAIAVSGAVFSMSLIAFLVVARGAHDAARMSRKRAANVLKAAVHYAQLSMLLSPFRVGWDGRMRSLFQAEDTASSSGLAVFDWDCIAGPANASYAAFVVYLAIPVLFLMAAPFAFPVMYAARKCFACARKLDTNAIADTLVSTFVTILYFMCGATGARAYTVRACAVVTVHRRRDRYPALVYRALTMLDCYTIASTVCACLRACIVSTVCACLRACIVSTVCACLRACIVSTMCACLRACIVSTVCACLRACIVSH